MLTSTVGVFAFVMLFVLFTAGRAGRGEPKPELKKGIRVLPLLPPMPALVLEFTKRGTGLHEIITNIGDPRVRKNLQEALRADSLFITLYLLLFTGIALVLGSRGGVWGWAALTAATCSVFAATADGVENLAMARAVERYRAGAAEQSPEPDAGDDSAEPDIATPGFQKWAFSFIAVALLALTFYGRGLILSDVVFWLCLLIAAVGGLGLVMLKVRPGGEDFRLVQLAFLLMLPLIALVGVAFWWHPEKF